MYVFGHHRDTTSPTRWVSSGRTTFCSNATIANRIQGPLIEKGGKKKKKSRPVVLEALQIKSHTLSYMVTDLSHLDRLACQWGKVLMSATSGVMSTSTMLCTMTDEYQRHIDLRQKEATKRVTTLRDK